MLSINLLGLLFSCHYAAVVYFVAADTDVEFFPDCQYMIDAFQASAIELHKSFSSSSIALQPVFALSL